MRIVMGLEMGMGMGMGNRVYRRGNGIGMGI